MELDGTPDSLERAMAALGAADPPAWSERAELASCLGEVLGSAKAPAAVAPAVELLRRLADDEKWEVRKAVAESLMHLRTDDFDDLITRLANDSTAWVRKAAERTLARRRRIEQVETKKRQRIESVYDDYEWFLNKYGQTAAERALRIGERYFEILASAATHEIRGVLTSLEGALANAAGDDASAEERATNLTKARERADFLNRILNDLKGYAQELTCEFQRENLGEIIAEATALVEDKVRPTGRTLEEIDLRSEIPDFIVIEASRYQLVQVFTNVIRNAFEAVDPGGTVTIGADLGEEDRVIVLVTDDGVGMSAGEVKDAFVPFKTSKKNEGGTGFGLPIAKKIVDAHGGAIRITSQEDRGTTVSITLPITRGEGSEE